MCTVKELIQFWSKKEMNHTNSVNNYLLGNGFGGDADQATFLALLVQNGFGGDADQATFLALLVQNGFGGYVD